MDSDLVCDISIAAPGVKAEPHLTHRFREEVAALLERKSLSFPGAQPVSFARKHLEELTRQDYFVCEKSDGIRYLMYCTTEYSSMDAGGRERRELHYLIDRKNDYWYVPGLHFPIPGDESYRAFHTDTIIDGELVIDKISDNRVQAKYLVFDCLMLDGNSLMNRTLDKRIAYFGEKIFKPYQKLYEAFPDEARFRPFVVELKQMQMGYGIEMMFRQILPNLPHGNDGLIFTCRNTDYKHGTDPHILKWKPESENSIDFRLRLDFPLVQPDDHDIAEGITKPYFDYDAMPIANLLISIENNKDEYYSTMYLEPSEWESLRALNEPLNDRIVECYMDAQKRWRYMRWRDDKEKPNHITTVESVIESITDRVTEKELIVAAKRIRDEWKKRNTPGGANGAGFAKRKASEQGGGRPSPGVNGHG